MLPCDWTSSTTCFIGTVYPGTFFWHVRARNAVGEGEWSPLKRLQSADQVRSHPRSLARGVAGATLSYDDGGAEKR